MNSEEVFLSIYLSGVEVVFACVQGTGKNFVSPYLTVRMGQKRLVSWMGLSSLIRRGTEDSCRRGLTILSLIIAEY